jgi:Flp pilus assembly protein TadD
LDAALDGFAALAMLAPGKPEYQFGFALCLQHFGQVEEAGRHFSAALVLDPSDAACAYRLGECLAACGYVEDARDALNVALALCSLPETDAAIRPLTESLLDRLV